MRVITADGVTRHSSDELEALLDGPGLVWIDVKYWDADTAELLAKRLHLHDRAVHECAVRNPVAKVHTYPDQAFVVLHAPEQGRGGHVHFVELDQVIGPNWLLTVHGPMNVAVELEAAYVETSTVARRLDQGLAAPDPALRAVGRAGQRARRPDAQLPRRADPAGVDAASSRSRAGTWATRSSSSRSCSGSGTACSPWRPWPQRAARCTAG